MCSELSVPSPLLCLPAADLFAFETRTVQRLVAIDLYSSLRYSTSTMCVVRVDMVMGDIPFEHDADIVAVRLSWERSVSSSTPVSSFCLSPFSSDFHFPLRFPLLPVPAAHSLNLFPLRAAAAAERFRSIPSAAPHSSVHRAASSPRTFNREHCLQLEFPLRSEPFSCRCVQSSKLLY